MNAVTPPIEANGANVLRDAPKGYAPTPMIAFLIGRTDNDVTLVQVWESELCGEPNVWVAVPKWLLHDGGKSVSLHEQRP